MAATKITSDVVEYAWRLLHDVGDTAPQQYLTDDTLTAFLGQAIRIYGKHRPRILVEDMTADGTNLSALPDEWVDGFSALVSIESPIGSNPPEYVDQRSWTLYRDATQTDFILWYSGAPGTNAEFRVAWTALHSYDPAIAANTTVPDVDFEAVGCLVASIGAEAIAAKFAQDSDSLVTADRASRATSQSEEWMKIARNLRGLYSRVLGLPLDGRKVASGWANWDSRDSRRTDWLTHPSRLS